MTARRPIRRDAERGGSPYPPRKHPAADVGAVGTETHRAGQTESLRRGFTIVELLATIALVGIVLPVVVHGVVLCLDTAGFATGQAEAAALAQSKMAELVATGQWYDAEMEGDFGEDYPDYRWLALVGDWDDSRLSQLDVVVTWTRREQEHAAVLSTLIYTGTPDE